MPTALVTCGEAGLTVALLAGGGSRSRGAEGFDPSDKVDSDLFETMDTQVCLRAWMGTSCPLQQGLVVGAVDYPCQGHLASLGKWLVERKPKALS